MASYCDSPDKHLRKAFRDIKDDLRESVPLSRALVNKHVKDVIRNRKAGKDVQAFSTSTNVRCRECKGCSLHCKDHKGKWQPDPSSYSSGDDSDGSCRGVRRSHDFKALRVTDALPHTYPATTERDGNAVIAEAKTAAKTAAKKAYLMHLARNMTSDDEAGVTDDSHDYYDDSAPIYSQPGDSD
jgi:hypothetical protein